MLTAGLNARDPEWAPQGDEIAFFRPGLAGIWLVSSEDGMARQLTSAPDLFPAWSPDGTRMVVLSGRDARIDVYDLWLLDLTTPTEPMTWGS